MSDNYGGPEYEAVSGFGSNCGVDDLQAIAKAKKRALAKLRAVFAAEGEGGGDFCPAPA